MREQSQKDEMAAALKGDFARLRRRGVSTTLGPAGEDADAPEPVASAPRPAETVRDAPARRPTPHVPVLTPSARRADALAAAPVGGGAPDADADRAPTSVVGSVAEAPAATIAEPGSGEDAVVTDAPAEPTPGVAASSVPETDAFPTSEVAPPPAPEAPPAAPTAPEVARRSLLGRLFGRGTGGRG